MSKRQFKFASGAVIELPDKLTPPPEWMTRAPVFFRMLDDNLDAEMREQILNGSWSDDEAEPK